MDLEVPLTLDCYHSPLRFQCISSLCQWRYSRPGLFRSKSMIDSADPDPLHRLSPSGHRAFLDFGQVPISAIGKYRCEITTEDEQPIPISGNLFVYSKAKGPKSPIIPFLRDSNPTNSYILVRKTISTLEDACLIFLSPIFVENFRFLQKDLLKENYGL